jgi:hypothetical protein
MVALRRVAGSGGVWSMVAEVVRRRLNHSL